MTVKELMELLKNLNPNAVVHIWNGEWDAKDPLNEVDVDADYDVVLS